jgi:hypothetical protein
MQLTSLHTEIGVGGSQLAHLDVALRMRSMNFRDAYSVFIAMMLDKEMGHNIVIYSHRRYDTIDDQGHDRIWTESAESASLEEGT